MIELLSPAGNKESFYAAINAGADAIYMGIDRFNARQMAENFTIEEFIECINYAHIFNVKVYLTLNTLIYTDELKEALEDVLKLYNAGLDAVIVQDIGMASLIKKYFKNLKIHASTQMTVHSLKQVKFLEKLGFDRVVLARELTLPEIEYIAKNSNIELEVFIHGALCVSYSGQCLMSSMIGNRSGNRGKCAGTCRLKYKLKKDNSTIFEGHLLSKKDIYGIDYAQKLKNIGITSLKIEGRGKTKEYISLVTRKYRKCIDYNNVDIDDEKELLQMFNRSSKCDGYFSKVRLKDSISYKTAKNTGLTLGEVIESKGSMIKIKLLEDIDMQDGIETYDGESSTIVTCIRDEKKNLVNKQVKKGNIVWLGDFKKLPKKGEVINKTSSRTLIQSETKYIKGNQRKRKIKVDVDIGENKNINIHASIDNKKVNLNYDYMPQKAVSKSLNKEYLEEILNKNKTDLFIYEIDNATIAENVFLPISVINDVRRRLSEELISKIKINRNEKLSFDNIFNYKIDKLNKNAIFDESLFVYKLKEKSIDKINLRNEKNVYINISDIMLLGKEILNKINKQIYIYIPNVILSNLERYIDENLEDIIKKYRITGILLGSFNYLEDVNILKKKYNFKIVIDYSLNVNNIISATFYKEKGADVITVSPELTDEEIDSINKIIDVEIVEDMVTVMTTRYCIIKSFDKCNCKNEDYYLEDSFGKKYNIVTDIADCISKYVRNVPRKYKSCNCRKRRCIIS